MDNFFNIRDDRDELELKLFSKFLTIRQPRYALSEAMRRDNTYSVQAYTRGQLIYLNDLNQTTDKEILICDIPLMTNEGTFLVNGVKRSIISQIVRSPGIYYKTEIDKHRVLYYTAVLISNRGAWIKFIIDKGGIINFQFNKTEKEKISAYIFLKAVGLTNLDIFSNLDNPYFFQKTSEKQKNVSLENAFLNLHKKLRPGEITNVKAGQQLLYSRFFDPKKYSLGRVGRHKINKRLNLDIKDNIHVLTPKDILCIVNELINFRLSPTMEDDIDHLGNRRVRAVGELMQNQLRIGLSRIERIAQERMTTRNPKYLRVNVLITSKPLASSIREFFGTNPLSQFMDQTNPLAELTHKRRLSVLGPGGITRERAGFAIRDIHPSQYGRICPVETPEGPNAGLIGSLSTYGKVNSYGFIEAPFYKVEEGKVLQNSYPIYLDAPSEEDYRIAAGDVQLTLDGTIQNTNIPVRYQNEVINVSSIDVDYIAVSPIQVVSLATALIPFLEHDDANRALMGSNMQRQSVPLLYPEAPLIGTGLEGQTARDSGITLLSTSDGKIVQVNGGEIVVKDINQNMFTYPLRKYQR